MKDVIIIGGGIAGLSAAFELYKNNIDFQILETSDRVGGNIETLIIDDYIVESGPHTFSSSSHEILELVKELGIQESLVPANPNSKKRYIYLNNQLVCVPSSPVEFFKSDILSKEGKRTVFEEFFIKKEEKEENVEDFISRRFGREVLKNLIQPFLNGIYAGDIKKLSANAVFPRLKDLEKSYKSIILGLIFSRKIKTSFKNLTLYSFNHGMETLTKELYEKLKNKITLNAKDIDISRAKDFFVTNFKANNKPINYTSNVILLAIPAHQMPNFSYLLPSKYLSDFSEIEHYPLATVTQVVDKSKLKKEPDGFGFLCTYEPHRKLLGTIWTSSVFPYRAPSNKVLLTSYIGGAHYKKVIDQPPEEISNLTKKEVSEVLNISDQNSISTLHVIVRPKAIPQYNMGHLDKVRRIEEIMKTNYGLFFTGNYLYGISINDTIKTSKSAVNKIKNYLNTIVKKEEALTVK